jgi:hypothetical protein
MYAAIRHFINRWNNYLITPEAKNHELIKVQNILHNSFPLQIIQKLQPTGQRKHNTNDNTKSKQKLVTFTFFGNETRRFTKMFKHTNLRIAFKTKSNIQQLLQPINPDDSYVDKFRHIGVYQLTCPIKIYRTKQKKF